MKNIFNLNLVGTNILCVVMEREVIFFNIIEEKIVKILNFKYQKVIEKMIGNKKRKRFSSSYSQTNSEVFDKVNPISRRT